MGRRPGSKNKKKKTKKIIRKAAIRPEVEFVEEDGETKVKIKNKEIIPEPKKYQKNPEVKMDLVRCVKCGKSNTTILSTTAFPTRHLMLEGSLVIGMRIQRRRCKDCGQNFILKLPLA